METDIYSWFKALRRNLKGLHENILGNEPFVKSVNQRFDSQVVDVYIAFIDVPRSDPQYVTCI